MNCEDTCLNALIGGRGDLARKLEGRLDSILREKIGRSPETGCPTNTNNNSNINNNGGDGDDDDDDDDDGASNHRSNEDDYGSRRFGESLSHFASGLVSVNRQDMFDEYDFGVPMNDGADIQDVLVLYDSDQALPSNERVAHGAKFGGPIPRTDAASATANCDQMNVVFVDPPSSAVRQCVAILGGQYQGYHVQKWMRVVGEGPHGKMDAHAPLRVTGRMTNTKGYDELLYPKTHNLKLHRDFVLKYLANYDEIRYELDAILKRIARDNTVIVSTVNRGQSELMANFVCSSRSRGFDIGNLIVFPTDEYSRDLAEGMGIATFFHETLMSSIPKEEAARYGDRTFGLIMMAKVICVHLVSDLGYDMLFQDVDVIWLKDPIEFFHNPGSAIANFDVYFQDDGNRQERYAPYSANSGFYYIRSNERSKLLFRTMMYSGDLILAARSHQQILITLLAEANSLTGLRVKVLNRDDDDFPGGFHYHIRKPYMKKFVRGAVHPYIFHMCWTLNKDDKLKFLRQMGWWYVEDRCIGKDSTGILSGVHAGSDIVGACCSAEPLFSCHYRDKPSIKTCTDSPPKDKGGASFW